MLATVGKDMLAVKRWLQQSPPVLNWDCWLTQIDLCNGHKTVVVLTANFFESIRLLYVYYVSPISSFVCIYRDVKIYRLVSKNSIEEAILHCAEKKLKLEMDVTGSNQKGLTLLLDTFSCAFHYT